MKKEYNFVLQITSHVALPEGVFLLEEQEHPLVAQRSNDSYTICSCFGFVHSVQQFGKRYYIHLFYF